MPRPTSASVTIVVVAVLALAACAASQAPMPVAAGPSADCGNAVTGLIGCLNYITPGNPQSKPPSDCCTEVKSALGSPATVACLCDAFGKDYGIPINLTRAAGLPAACGGNPAAFSKCHLKLPGAPGAAPTQTPSPSSGSTTPATGSSGPGKSAATRSPISAATRSPISAATVVLAAVAAPLLSYCYL